MSVNMYSSYPQLAFNCRKKLLRSHAQKFAREGSSEIMSTFFNQWEAINILSSQQAVPD